jgi:hypothetical protein
VLDTYLDRQKSREECKNKEERCNIYRGLDKKIEEIEEGSSKDSSNTRAIEAIESEGKTAQQMFQQQQQKQQGPQQTLTQQQQQEFANVE